MTDMSSGAVTARLCRSEQLRRLCLGLGRARPLSQGTDRADAPERRSPQDPSAVAEPSRGPVGAGALNVSVKGLLPCPRVYEAEYDVPVIARAGLLT